MSNTGHLSLRTRIFYGIGSVAYGVKDNGFAFLLLLYYDQVLGLSAQLASLAIFIALVFDAISDPIVGAWSDRLHSKWGRRHPFMYAAALPAAFSYYTLWNPPDLEGTALFAYLVLCAIGVRTFITFFEVPSTALAPELTEDYDERTLLLTVRYFFGWTGGITLSIIAYGFLFVPTDEYPVGQLNPRGYEIYGAVASAMMFAAILVSARGTHRHIPDLKRPPPRAPFSLARNVREMRETLSNRSFLALFGFGIFAAMASGLVASMSIYFNTFFWGFTAEQIAIITPAAFGAALIALVATPVVSLRWGKRKAAFRCALAAGLLSPAPMALRLLGLMPPNGSTELLLTLVVYNVIEIGLIIIVSTLIGAMMADVVEQSELQTGRRSEGTFYAARSFVQKSLSGLGIVMATLLLGAVGFPEDAKPGDVDAETLRRLALGYIPTVGALYLTAFVCLLGYRISREDHAANLDRLEDLKERER